MELQGKFDAKAAENEIRVYLDNIALATLLENELLDSKYLVGYIEGPPTMNGEPHAGHLRGRKNKNLWYRFNTLPKKESGFQSRLGYTRFTCRITGRKGVRTNRQ